MDTKNGGRLIKNIIINVTILLLLADTVSTMILNFMYADTLKPFHAIDFSIDLIMLLVLWNLFLRKILAWRMTMGIILINILMCLGYIDFSRKVGLETQIEMVVLIISYFVFIIFSESFKRRYTNRSIKSAFFASGAALAIIIFSLIFSNVTDVMDNIGGEFSTPLGMLSSLAVWVLMALAVFLALRPAVSEASAHKSEKSFARIIVNKHSNSAVSYLALEDDKMLYFGKDVEGVISYGVVSGVAVVLGDPICAKEDFSNFLSEWRRFCWENEYSCLFMGATDEYLDLYEIQGYSFTKCGEEARFDLENLSLSGKKKAKMRMNINHANSAGLETFEYKPNEGRDEEIEKGIRAVSDDWLGGKKSGQLKFSVGDVNLEEPLDRRYFYAKNPEGKIVGFNVFLPFLGMDGYVADVTRRTKDAPGGVTEKLLYDALAVFKEEGCHWGSVGLAPLANVLGGEGQSPIVSRMLHLMYEKGNMFYGFKDLYQTKKRYGSEVWVPGYFVYSGKVLNARMLFALAAIQSSNGVMDYIGSFLKALKKSPPEKRTPAKTDEPVKADEPAEAEKPVEQKASAKVDESAKAEKPAVQKAPTKADAPAEQKAPAKADEPAKAEKPAVQKAPAKADEPAKTEKPVAEKAPATAEKPAVQETTVAKTDAPVKTERPAAQAMPEKSNEPAEQIASGSDDGVAEQTAPTSGDEPADQKISEENDGQSE